MYPTLAGPPGESSWSFARLPQGQVEDNKLEGYGTSVAITWSLLSGVAQSCESRVSFSFLVLVSLVLLSPGEEKKLLVGKTVWLTA